MEEMDAVVIEIVALQNQGRNDELLRLLTERFDQSSKGIWPVGRSRFILLFVWGQLAEKYPPAHEALLIARDEQISRLLDGDALFGVRDAMPPSSRFSVVREMNNMLKDDKATYELFVRLLDVLPERAKKDAYTALPAIVEAGDFTLAERYLPEPLDRLAELNQLACSLPLLPPLGVPPRMVAELSNFMKDVMLRAAILQGLGRQAEADTLHEAALAGLASEEMRALASKELAVPGSIIGAHTAHMMSLEDAAAAKSNEAV